MPAHGTLDAGESVRLDIAAAICMRYAPIRPERLRVCKHSRGYGRACAYIRGDVTGLVVDGRYWGLGFGVGRAGGNASGPLP